MRVGAAHVERVVDDHGVLLGVDIRELTAGPDEGQRFQVPSECKFQKPECGVGAWETLGESTASWGLAFALARNKHSI